MAPPSYPKDLLLYHTHLRRHGSSFSCPYPSCRMLVTPQKFEKHCKLFHQLNSNLCCVWCRGGRERRQWVAGQKSAHGLHLQSCFKQFMDSLPLSPLETDPGPTLSHLKLLSMTISCPTHCFFNHSNEFLQNLPRALDGNLYPLSVDSSPLLPFRDASLNLATLYLQKYLVTRNQCDWIHIMVKAVSFTSFLEAMEADLGVTRTLDFSCWCDGGKYPQPKHRQHRHLIVVAFRGHFQSHVWPHVTVAPENRPCPRFPCKGMKRILSPRHLVNTLGYLSQRRSRCQFTLDSRKGARQNKHFHIFQSLPIDYRKVLATQWEKGVYELLYQEKFQNVSIERMMEQPLLQVGRQWKQKIGNFYHLERGLVLPIEKSFTPTSEPTPHFMYLMNGRKLYFQSEPENEALDDDAWLQKQARGGHCFYENVGEELWTPRPRDQKVIKRILQERQRHRELERENAALRETMRRLEEEKNHWKRKCQTLQENEMKRLRKENKRLRESLQRLANP